MSCSITQNSRSCRFPPVVPAGMDALEDEGDAAYEEVPAAAEGPGLSSPALSSAAPTLTPPYMLVRVLGDMDSFMGVDGRIYTLLKGDIVTLPERNASVLSDRNIVVALPLPNLQITGTFGGVSFVLCFLGQRVFPEVAHPV